MHHQRRHRAPLRLDIIHPIEGKQILEYRWAKAHPTFKSMSTRGIREKIQSRFFQGNKSMDRENRYFTWALNIDWKDKNVFFCPYVLGL